MTDDLMPCAFCGGKGEWYDQVTGIRTVEYCIECSVCLIQTQWSTCKDSTRQIWNNRPNSSTIDKKLAEFNKNIIDSEVQTTHELQEFFRDNMSELMYELYGTVSTER